MDTVLGLIGMAVYMAATVGLAAGVTYLIVKLSPAKSVKEIEERKERKERAAAE
jgi:hypothetical protein